MRLDTISFKCGCLKQVDLIVCNIQGGSNKWSAALTKACSPYVAYLPLNMKILITRCCFALLFNEMNISTYSCNLNFI